MGVAYQKYAAKLLGDLQLQKGLVCLEKGLVYFLFCVARDLRGLRL